MAGLLVISSVLLALCLRTGEAGSTGSSLRLLAGAGASDAGSESSRIDPPGEPGSPTTFEIRPQRSAVRDARGQRGTDLSLDGRGPRADLPSDRESTTQPLHEDPLETSLAILNELVDPDLEATLGLSEADFAVLGEITSRIQAALRELRGSTRLAWRRGRDEQMVELRREISRRLGPAALAKLERTDLSVDGEPPILARLQLAAIESDLSDLELRSAILVGHARTDLGLSERENRSLQSVLVRVPAQAAAARDALRRLTQSGGGLRPGVLDLGAPIEAGAVDELSEVLSVRGFAEFSAYYVAWKAAWMEQPL